MQATALPYAGSHAIVPLLELALAQTNGHGAYIYRFEPGDPFARLAAWAGLAPAESDWRNLKTPGYPLQRPTAVVLHERQPLEIVVEFGRLGDELVRFAFEDAEYARFLLRPCGRRHAEVPQITG